LKSWAPDQLRITPQRGALRSVRGMMCIHHASLPGLTRQSILFREG